MIYEEKPPCPQEKNILQPVQSQRRCATRPTKPVPALRSRTRQPGEVKTRETRRRTSNLSVAILLGVAVEVGIRGSISTDWGYRHGDANWEPQPQLDFERWPGSFQWINPVSAGSRPYTLWKGPDA